VTKKLALLIPYYLIIPIYYLTSNFAVMSLTGLHFKYKIF